MSMDISFHRVARLQAKADRGKNCSWVTLEVACSDGDPKEIVLFFHRYELAQAYADAINAVGPTGQRPEPWVSPRTDQPGPEAE
jgi:hypothetical protein